jgi:hypothetical protein
MSGPSRVVPFSFDLSSLVASLYSHLVTRPTGRALRLGIESQIGEIGSVCVSVLDFTQVMVLDYSCADEAVAKLIQRYAADDRPADAYFVARGLADQHREPIDEVLMRHGLALVAEVDGAYELLGRVTALEQDTWGALQQARSGSAAEIAGLLGGSAAHAGSVTAIDGLGAGDAVDADAAIAATLASLADRRVIVRRGTPATYVALTTLLPDVDGDR